MPCKGIARVTATVAQKVLVGIPGIRSSGVDEDAQQQAIDSLRTGSPDEAAVAVGRLLAVTEAAYERRAQLEQALQSRVAIEQAKGVLAERYGLELDAAFELIRRAARSNRMKLHDLVRKVKPGEPTPEELTSYLEV
jgi:hypothetical protein